MKELRLEADRCLLCKNARCKANCPISTEIPEVIRLFKEGKLDEQEWEMMKMRVLALERGVREIKAKMDVA